MSEGTARLPLKVIPGSTRDGVVGWLGDALRVRVTAAPERGKAYAAAEEAVAEALGVRAECARIVAGSTSARKVIEIDGLTEAEVRRRLPEGKA